MLVYKLTDKRMMTYGNTQWQLKKSITVSGKGYLCGPGWLHWYFSPELAVLLNPIHGAFDPATMRLFEAEAEGTIAKDHQLKGGSTTLTLMQEINIPQISKDQKISFAIQCLKQVNKGEEWWQNWADNWLSGKDRTVLKHPYPSPISTDAFQNLVCGLFRAIHALEWGPVEPGPVEWGDQIIALLIMEVAREYFLQPGRDPSSPYLDLVSLVKAVL